MPTITKCITIVESEVFKLEYQHPEEHLVGGNFAKVQVNVIIDAYGYASVTSHTDRLVQ